MSAGDGVLDALDADDGRVLPRRRLKSDNALDITPMIDVTFLLLIFFIVAGRPDVQAALSLPTAEYGVGVSQRESLVISVAEGDRPGSVLVYLADGKVGEPLSGDAETQEAQIRAAAESAVRLGVTEVLIKAEKGVRHGNVARVIQGAAARGMKFNLAVAELR